MRKGFTLIELLIVIAILGIIFSIIFSNCQGSNTAPTNDWDPYKYAPPAQEQKPTR